MCGNINDDSAISLKSEVTLGTYPWFFCYLKQKKHGSFAGTGGQLASRSALQDLCIEEL